MPERQLRTVRRRIGMMFQGGALLDSMTVFDNVALALREHTQLSEREIARTRARAVRGGRAEDASTRCCPASSPAA